MSSSWIAGFHRSGTSALSARAQADGRHLALDMMSPHVSNPDGHFEDLWLVGINDAALASRGESWQCSKVLEFHRCRRTDLETSMQVYVNQRNRVGLPWTAKDPRLGLTLSAWLSAVPQAFESSEVLVPLRHPAACADSLQRRHAAVLAELPCGTGLEAHLGFWTQPDLAVSMWLAHHQSLLSLTQQAGPRLHCRIEPLKRLLGIGYVEQPIERGWLGIDGPTYGRVCETLESCCGGSVLELGLSEKDLPSASAGPTALADAESRLWAAVDRLTFTGDAFPTGLMARQPVEVPAPDPAALDRDLGRWSQAAAQYAARLADDVDEFDARMGWMTCSVLLGWTEQANEFFRYWLARAARQALPAHQWQRASSWALRLDPSSGMAKDFEASLREAVSLEDVDMVSVWARWLISRGRTAEADAFLTRWASASSVPAALRAAVTEWALLRGRRPLALQIHALVLTLSCSADAYRGYLRRLLDEVADETAREDLAVRLRGHIDRLADAQS